MSELLKTVLTKIPSALSLHHSQYIHGMSLPTSDVISPSKSCEIPLIFFKTSLSITSKPINILEENPYLNKCLQKSILLMTNLILNIKSVIC